MPIRRLVLLIPLTIAATAGAAPASVPGKSKPAHGPTALHTTHVRTKDASEPSHDKKVDDKAIKKDEGKSSAKPDPKGVKPDAKDGKGARPEARDMKVDPKGAKGDPSKHDEKDEKSAKGSSAPDKKVAVHPPCLRFPVWVTRGAEEDFFPLTTCDGSDAPGAIEHLSILARPESAQKPSVSVGDLMKQKGDMVSPGIKRLDERLPHALQVMLDHFDKPGPTRKVHVISGYRPASKGSYHATGQAIDFRIDGVSNEQLVAYCKTLGDVGCGYYPNSTFIHMDVRADGTGHVSWIDASGPGESPRYVSAWPPPPEPAPAVDGTHPDKILEPLPQDDHPATVASPDMTADASPDGPMQ